MSNVEIEQNAQVVTEPVKTETTQAQENIPEETPEQINWKKFRLARAEERKKREETERELAKRNEENAALKAALESIVNKPASNEPVDESEEEAFNKKIDRAFAEREKKYEQERQARERQELPTVLAKTFNDFHDTCTAENLDYLEFHYPEVAAGFKHMPDNFEKWSTVYKAIKRFIPNSTSQKDVSKADRNALKPKSMSVGGTTQTSDVAPMILDDKRRADNWARMQRVMRGAK